MQCYDTDRAVDLECREPLLAYLIVVDPLADLHHFTRKQHLPLCVALYRALPCMTSQRPEHPELYSYVLPRAPSPPGPESALG